MGDVPDGHGTHVAGCAVGSPAGGNASAAAADYRGVAPGAKLAFDDVSADGTTLWLPADLNAGLFPHAYAAGARTHSLSWGDAVASRYDANAMEVCRVGLWDWVWMLRVCIGRVLGRAGV